MSNNKYTEDDYCDLIPGGKICDNCGKCLEEAGVDIRAIKIEDIAKIVENYKIGKNGYIVLMDAQGIVLTHPNKDMISKPMPDSLKEIKAAMNKQEVQ